MSNWEMVTGEDGEQYLKWDGQIRLPANELAPNAAYTIDALLNLQNMQWPKPYLSEPGDPVRSKPEHGRFQNLEWEDET